MDGYINSCGSAVAKVSWSQMLEHRPTQKGLFVITVLFVDFVLWLLNCQQQQLSVTGIITGCAFIEVLSLWQYKRFEYPLPTTKKT